MIAQTKEFFKVAIGLTKFFLMATLYVAVFVGLMAASFALLVKGTEDYGLLAGTLVAIPFVAFLWFAVLAIAAWLGSGK